MHDGHTRLIIQGRLSDGRRFHWTVTRPGLVFFMDREDDRTLPGAFRKSVHLANLRGEPVDALYFDNTLQLNRARSECTHRSIPAYEADVNPLARFLMERFIKGSVCFACDPGRSENNTAYFVDPPVKPSAYLPELKLLSIDIECSLGTDLYSIALVGDDFECVLMVDPGKTFRTSGSTCRTFDSERALLSAFIDIVRLKDPDVFIGWNLIGFDLQWLARKYKHLKMSFDIGCDGTVELLPPAKSGGQWLARIPGRAALDGIPMSRSAYIQTQDYSLATVARNVLGSKKRIEKTGLERAREISRLYRENKAELARYNLQDARLVYRIFQKLNLVPMAVRRSQLTGLSLDRVGGSIAAFDFLYLPRLHRSGYVADTDPFPPRDAEKAPGGMVFDSKPGFYHNVAVFDFKSLYPSIILTFHVDPLAASIARRPSTESRTTGASTDIAQTVKGPAGLAFSRGHAILPAIIQELWQEREQASASRDATLSQAVKIIMNSFYGVLGSTGCRFYDPLLAGTITRIGHWVLQFSRNFIEKQGYPVIYGDTDSLFVHLGQMPREEIRPLAARLSLGLNRLLKKEIRRRFHAASRLDIRFEKCFVRFFMPTVRGRETGSKKRYAGLFFNAQGDAELYFAGLESIRRDWTDLAKAFQADLFTLLFHTENTVELKKKLVDIVRDRQRKLYEGALDETLIYRKGISKRLQDYTRNVPPHVQAARKLDRLDGRVVSYLITTAGPEPIQKRSGAPFDYHHYSEKQLAPVADMILSLFDMDYRSIVANERQLPLF